MIRLEVVGLTKRYGENVALNGVTVTFTPGIYGLLGANGAGKSTLMNLITDNIKRDAGKIAYCGREILDMGNEFRALLGYMPQQQGLYEQMTAASFISYIGRLKGLRGKQLRTQTERTLELVNLSDSRHKKLGGFSGRANGRSRSSGTGTYSRFYQGTGPGADCSVGHAYRYGY